MSRHVTGVIWETASMESCGLISDKTDNKREEQSWDEKAVIWSKWINSSVGKSISFCLAKGLSRAELSKVIDVTYQQLQKYENGTNRVSASRLLLIAKALEHEIPYFYEGFERSDNRGAGTVKSR